MNTPYDIAIIGAGPAGLMAAIAASKNSSVVLIEKNELVGRKILATGNGRCNITNRFAEVSRYHSNHPAIIKDVLAEFDQSQAMKFFEGLGIVLKEEDNGRIFPRTNQAQTVVDALSHEVHECGVKVKTNAEVRNIAKEKTGFKILLKNGEAILSNKLILSTGGKAAHHLGSSGDGLFWAKVLGHTITPTYPALVPIETVETWPREISGLRVEGKSTVTLGDKIISEKSGDILFTHFGLSAPAIMAHAGKLAPHLGQDLKVHIDLFDEMSEKELDATLAEIFAKTGKKTLKNSLSGLIANNLAPVILKLCEIADRKSAEISKIDRLKIAQTLKDLTLTVKGLRSFKEAQVTSGGIALDEINPETLESKKISGLYFAGEILDVYGDSGGFNLQWAWSSGHLAGVSSSN
jgi:predicted Rossmann fold flavoprotein